MVVVFSFGCYINIVSKNKLYSMDFMPRDRNLNFLALLVTLKNH